ncbi:conserved hypothetical protein [Uncinocarpus reesii 1704]|uniref:2-hydroxyacyl-CoA lyase n=1 Tax=Uncinocarpus reesii (strain UAMH 1704) TaxID=336963 RepID=C4JIU9_UNCRE|nr:uncharacterized protein UREG_01556 [Uncinocarpus reesii 1704]EEP76707.1 conserved hypothetical protein [Uncinocarpus reesii 1704]
MTGRPGVCLVVGGPGVLHAMAGIGNATANAFPLLVLAGSVETAIVTKGGFQELDAISLLNPHTKFAVRPTSADGIGAALQNAYRTCWYGRPGTSFVDLPADLIRAKALQPPTAIPRLRLPAPPKSSANPVIIHKVAQLLKSATAPLIVIGKGAAYARAEFSIRQLVEGTRIPFLPTPMGKGVMPDSHYLNTSSARSVALRNADVVLLLGARLNWILHLEDTSLATLDSLSAPEDGNIVYVSEGANTMDISRSVFQLQHPRQKLDAGTSATMGVGLGYIVAAHAAYNISSIGRGPQNQKKIVAFEGDSAFGFSAMEIETLARQQIPALIFVMNNSGIYHGDTENEEEWRKLQKQTVMNETQDHGRSYCHRSKKGLRSTSLLYNTRYEYLATMCGGVGYFVRTEQELEDATRQGFLENERVVLVNVIVEPGVGQTIQFGWQSPSKKTGHDARL